jgi:hypothetical protein
VHDDAFLEKSKHIFHVGAVRSVVNHYLQVPGMKKIGAQVVEKEANSCSWFLNVTYGLTMYFYAGGQCYDILNIFAENFGEENW